VIEPNILRHGAEKRNAGTDENWNAVEDQAMEQTGREKSLNRPSTVHVEVLPSTRLETPHEIGWLSAHGFDPTGELFRDRHRVVTQDDNRFGAIRPRGRMAHHRVGGAPEDNRADALDEGVIAAFFVGWTATTAAKPIH
jgi:hypothetical protein